MKFGFTVFPYDMYESTAEMARVVQRGEEVGFDYVAFPEHVVPSPAINEQLANKGWPDFPTLAAFLAGQTKRIEFLSGIYLLPLANPFRLARQLVTLDQVSGGRVIFGVGVGWNKQEFDAMGISFADRAAITDEYIRAMKALWSQDVASFSGKHVRFENIEFQPKPKGRNVRVLTGGAAVKGPIERVAKVCDGWIPWKIPRGDLPAAMSELRAALAREGRQLKDIDVVWGLTLGLSAASKSARKHASDGKTEDKGVMRPIKEEIVELEALGITRCNVSFAADTPRALIAALETFASEHIRK